jgi:hypothetical protein
MLEETGNQGIGYSKRYRLIKNDEKSDLKHSLIINFGD